MVTIPESKYRDDGQGVYWDGTPEEEQQWLAETALYRLTSAVQSKLDSVAREKNYDGILSACTYATSLNPTFQTEGQLCVVWRDACWTKCYQVMAEVQGSLRAIPTVEELLAELPTAPW